MNRLTEHHVIESGAYMACSGPCDKDEDACGACPELEKIVDRLAAYEDTGLEPDELEKLVAFKEYFDALYGQGLQIANWHMNGDLEPFDSFYEEAIADNEEKDPDGKNDQMEP